MHVCILTTAHAVDDMRVAGKFAAAFLAAGHELSWIGPAHANFNPVAAKRTDIHFMTVPPITGRWRRLLAARTLSRAAGRFEGVDVYYCPDPDSAELGIRLAKRNGAKVIFDVHEMYHKALLALWLRGRDLPFLREWVRRRIARTCSRADLVIAVSETVLSAFVTGDRRGALVVRSGAPRSFAGEGPTKVLAPESDCFRVMHGRPGKLRGTEAVMAGAVLASQRIPNLRVVVIGAGGEKKDETNESLRALAATCGAKEVLEVRDGVPYEEVPEMLRACDVGFLAWGRAIGEDVLPNRLFEYMAVGLPVVGPAYAPEVARILRAEACGILVDFESPEKIAEALVYLKEHPEECREMGRRGRAAFLERHNFENEVRPVLQQIATWFPGRTMVAGGREQSVTTGK